MPPIPQGGNNDITSCCDDVMVIQRGNVQMLLVIFFSHGQALQEMTSHIYQQEQHGVEGKQDKLCKLSTLSGNAFFNRPYAEVAPTILKTSIICDLSLSSVTWSLVA